MTTYTIKPNELEAIALASSTEQTRYYLNGVNVDLNADGSIALVATDGHRMASLRASLREPVKESFILATADIKKALQLVKSEKLKIPMTIEINKADEVLTVTIISTDKEGVKTGHGSFFTKAIDGQFPDYRRVIPSSKPSAEPIAFNASYMADFGKMAKLLGSSCNQVKITNTGASNPMLIELPGAGDFLGVLMPMGF